MPKLLLWFTYLCLALLSIAGAAYNGQPLPYLLTSAAVCLTGAFFGFVSLLKLHQRTPSQSLLSSATAEIVGTFWLWGGLSLLVTYYFFLPPWREWGTFSATLTLLALFSFLFSWVMKKDAQKEKEDVALLKIGRYLILIQLVGTLLTMIGLLLDPQKSLIDPGKQDWAANSLFFFGAFELATVSIIALFCSNPKNT